MGGSHSKGVSNFIEQSTKHYTDNAKTYSVHLWQIGENDTMVYNNTEVPKGVLPHNHEFGGMPVFQSNVQSGWSVVKVKEPSDGGTMVLNTDGDIPCMAFMPAGFRGGPTPNKINPFREQIGNPTGETPEKCAASLCHVVTIPKNIRRYNIITCTSEDVPMLREMEKVGKQACMYLRDAPDTVVGSLRWHLKQDGTITLTDGTVVSTKLVESDFVDSTQFSNAQRVGIDSVLEAYENSIVTTFHVGESASVGYLHCHTRPTCFDLTSRENMDQMALSNDYLKETTIDECIKVLEMEQFKNMVAESLVVNDTPESQPEPELDQSESDDDDGSVLSRQYSVRE